MNRDSRTEGFCKKGALKNSQNPQENVCVRVSFLIKLQDRPVTLFKKRSWHRCFPVNFPKFPEHLFSHNTFCGCFCIKMLLLRKFKGLSETFNEFSERFGIATLQIYKGKQISFATQKCGRNTLLKRHMKTSRVTLLLFF